MDRLNKACNQSNLLAHVADIFSSEEEVVKSLVAHFKHACGERLKKRESEREREREAKT